MYTAIPPPAIITETDYTQQTRYERRITSSREDRTDITYAVHGGAQFGIECSSVAVENDTESFAGEVTWYKKTGE